MKKAFSLMEILVAVTLLTVVIATVLQVQQNNLSFIDKFKSSVIYDEYLSIALIEQNSSKELRNTHLYLDEVVKFKDDDVRKRFKTVKVFIKDKEGMEVDLSTEEFPLFMKHYISEYKIDGKVSKKFYSFELEH